MPRISTSRLRIPTLGPAVALATAMAGAPPAGAVVRHDGVPTRAAATSVPTSGGTTSSIGTHVPWD